MIQSERITRKAEVLRSYLDERQLRVWAALEAESIGRGGIAAVEKATGISHTTIGAGLAEIRPGAKRAPPGAVRHAGAGRKRLEQTDPGLIKALVALVDPVTRGDPESPLRWTSKSVQQLASELTREGHAASPWKVRNLLHEMHYTLQGTRKTSEGKQHPDRDLQFRHIAWRATEMQRHGEPVISVDTKKKELVGDFSRAGKEWQPQGSPIPVRVHDFIDAELGKAIPYGVYDLTANRGWVSVGRDHDTAEFSVQTIRRWWNTMGRKSYPNAKRLLITADGGGSNGSRSRFWKQELQNFADETGLQISVCHFPPGTSKWNKIEHRMFSYITENWRGRPLVSHEAIVNLIANTTTKTGLKINAGCDTSKYPLGVKVSDTDMATLQLVKDAFHGEWNYAFEPRNST